MNYELVHIRVFICCSYGFVHMSFIWSMKIVTWKSLPWSVISMKSFSDYQKMWAALQGLVATPGAQPRRISAEPLVETALPRTLNIYGRLFSFSEASFFHQFSFRHSSTEGITAAKVEHLYAKRHTKRVWSCDLLNCGRKGSTPE